jgi:hypothetical protein
MSSQATNSASTAPATAQDTAVPANVADDNLLAGAVVERMLDEEEVALATVRSGEVDELLSVIAGTGWENSEELLSYGPNLDITGTELDAAVPRDVEEAL